MVNFPCGPAGDFQTEGELASMKEHGHRSYLDFRERDQVTRVSQSFQHGSTRTQAP